MLHWGRHCIINARKCHSQLIANPRNIEMFLETLVQRIDMKAFGRPLIQHFGEGNKSGYTAVQLIETSNIMLHACDETGDMYADIFSCKWFDENVARVVVQQWFKPEHIDLKVIDRDARVPMA